jgi:hypothetical protein
MNKRTIKNTIERARVESDVESKEFEMQGSSFQSSSLQGSNISNITDQYDTSFRPDAIAELNRIEHVNSTRSLVHDSPLLDNNHSNNVWK